MADLAAGTCAQYNVITPDQYNDMHTALSAGFTYNGVHYTGDNAQVAQGDNFLSIVIPQIMASPQYQNNGVIIIWTDETEGSPQNDFEHTLTEIVISPLAKGNAYASTLNYTHSSDLNTMQKIYQVVGEHGLGIPERCGEPLEPDPADPGGHGLRPDAPWPPISGQSATPPSGYGTGQAYDLSDLFKPGVIPASIPTVSILPERVRVQPPEQHLRPDGDRHEHAERARRRIPPTSRSRTCPPARRSRIPRARPRMGTPTSSGHPRDLAPATPTP